MSGTVTPVRVSNTSVQGSWFKQMAQMLIQVAALQVWAVVWSPKILKETLNNLLIITEAQWHTQLWYEFLCNLLKAAVLSAWGITARRWLHSCQRDVELRGMQQCACIAQAGIFCCQTLHCHRYWSGFGSFFTHNTVGQEIILQPLSVQIYC